MKKLFHIGVAVILISYIIGWISVALGAVAYPNISLVKFWGGVYIFTWIMLGFGFLMSGLEAIHYAKQHMKKIVRWSHEPHKKYFRKKHR